MAVIDRAERYHALADQWRSGHLSPKDAAARVSALLGEIVTIESTARRFDVAFEELAKAEQLAKEIGEDAIRELMAKVDEYIPTPDRPIDKPFLMASGVLAVILGVVQGLLFVRLAPFVLDSLMLPTGDLSGLSGCCKVLTG